MITAITVLILTLLISGLTISVILNIYFLITLKRTRLLWRRGWKIAKQYSHTWEDVINVYHDEREECKDRTLKSAYKRQQILDYLEKDN